MTAIGIHKIRFSEESLYDVMIKHRKKTRANICVQNEKNEKHNIAFIFVIKNNI